MYLDGEHSLFSEIQAYLQPLISQVIHKKKMPGYREYMDDLIQDCWVEVIKNLPRWDPKRGSLKNFMFKCFSNRIITCLNRYTVGKHNVQIEELEEVLSGPSQNTESTGDLNLQVESRFYTFTEEYILRKVCIALYLKVFDRAKRKIVKELMEMTGYNKGRILFLIDYSRVVIRKRLMEIECQLKLSDVS